MTSCLTFGCIRQAFQRDTLAREIAERSVAATLNCLGADAEKMSPAELRGYVRAHAMPFVYDEAIQLVGRELPERRFERAWSLSAVEQTVSSRRAPVQGAPDCGGADAAYSAANCRLTRC